MALVDNIKLLELPAYFGVLLCFLVIGILHFWCLIVPILGIQLVALWFYPENICLWALPLGYVASIKFRDSIIAPLEKLMINIAPCLFVKISHN